jgi:hypothetical protein
MGRILDWQNRFSKTENREGIGLTRCDWAGLSSVPSGHRLFIILIVILLKILISGLIDFDWLRLGRTGSDAAQSKSARNYLKLSWKSTTYAIPRILNHTDMFQGLSLLRLGVFESLR